MNPEEKRKNRNREIIARMRKGDPLTHQAESTWFQPRPKIEKDPEALSILYKKKKNSILKSVE